jgi:biopolymer transport protein ExbB
MNPSRKSWLLMLIGCVAVVLWFAPLAMPPAAAQEEAAESDAPALPREAGAEEKTLMELIRAGGWCMWPLAAFSIAAVALTIRNFLALKENKLLRPDLVPTLTQQMAQRDVHAARQLCDQEPSLLTYVLAAGLDRITGDSISLESVEEAMEEAGSEQVAVYMAPISYLSIIGVVSPMLGLLGTVSGMIKAFQNIAGVGLGKPELLAENIYEALVTTATGLIIAIPTMMFYFYFKHKFMKTMATMGRINGVLVDTLRTGQMPSRVTMEHVSADVSG